jgi:hypothetical protein
MEYIQTANYKIYPQICKALDKYFQNIYHKTGQWLDDGYKGSKYKLYQSELLDYIRSYNPLLADKCKTNCLYYLYGMADTLRIEEGQFINERMHSNAHTAHEQLKNWK